MPAGAPLDPRVVPERILGWATSGRPALTDGAGVWTFDELAARAGRVAHRLGGTTGLAGAHIALLATPDCEWVASLLGIWSAGGVAVPLSPQYPAAELAWFCDDAAVRTAIVSPDYRALAADLGRSRPVVEPAALSAPGPPARAPVALDSGDAALLVYTSGTTGKPKGALHTHGSLAVQTSVLASHWGIVPEDRLLHALPLHHVHGLVVALLTVLAAGGSVHLLPRFEVPAVIHGLAQASVWMAVPTMYQKLRFATEQAAALASAAAGLRLATSGSAALPVTTAAWWAELAGAIPLERYGMTETGIVLSNPIAPAARRRGEVGGVLPTFEVRLAAEAGDGRAGAAGSGELEVRGPSVFAGYWQRRVATRDAFTADGWFRTGDRAVCSPGGSFRLLGRTNVDVIKSGGYKLSALEIEEALRGFPGLVDVAVVGVADELWGERVVAMVEAAAAIDLVRLRDFARRHLAAYQVPKDFVRVDALPRNVLGKVQKSDVLARLTPAGRN